MTDLDLSAFVDFDHAWIEHKARPFTITVPAEEGTEFEGDEVKMPASMPAGFKLHLLRVRLERGEDHDLSQHEMQVAASFLFGEHRVAEWIAARIGEDTLADAVTEATLEYARRRPARHSKAEKDGDGEGKAPGGSASPATSSSTGSTSKPTSDASTGSGSFARCGT